MKMIKLTEKHYILVDDKFDPIGSDGKYVHKSGRIWQWDSGMAYVSNNPPQPITHSTQPEFLGTGWMQSVLPLLLSEVKELIGEVNVKNKANDILKGFVITKDERKYFEFGYNQALEDNKDKKYTEEDMKYMFECGRNYQNNAEITFKVSMEYIQPKTEWEVEIVNNKLKLKS